MEVRDLDRAGAALREDGRPRHALIERGPAALDGTDLTTSPDGVRAALARWITAPENPWFSRAFVNRMWAHFVGRGFVDPVDDLRPSNPPAAPATFDALAADFVTSGYDVKHLVRVIAGSGGVDGLSAAPLEAMPAARSRPRGEAVGALPRDAARPGEELLNALVAATKGR